LKTLCSAERFYLMRGICLESLLVQCLLLSILI